MFEVRKLEDALKPLFFVSMVLGLEAPLRRKGRTIHFILHHLYNSAIFVFHCYSCGIIIESALKNIFLNSSETASLTIFTLAAYATPLTAMLTSIWVSKKRRNNILRSMERVDYIFMNNPLHKYRRIRKLIWIIIVICTLWVLVEIVLYSTTYRKKLVLFYLVYYTNMIIAIHTAFVVMLLYAQFKKLNEILSSVRYHFSVSLDLKDEYSYLDCIPTNLNPAKSNKLRKSYSVHSNGTYRNNNLHNTRETLKYLRRIHMHLVKDAESINTNQGVKYVALVLEAVICSVVAIFMFFEMVKFRADGMILSLVSAIVRSLLKTSSISFACELTSKEARRTGAILQDLILEEEEELVTSLQHFAEQLKHTRVQFSACGFFPMRASLMSGVIASVVTYSIILIQFVISENSGSTNSSRSCTHVER